MSVKSTNKYVEVLDSSGNQIDSTHPLYTSPATGSTTDVSDRAARDLGKVDIAAFDSALPAGTNLMGKVGIDQTTPGTTNGVYVNTVAAGGSVDIGALAAAAVTDPTASASVIAALKGLLKQLQGTAAIVTKVNIEPSTLASTYFIKRTNITTASVNLAFGFTSKTIMIETGQSNDAEIAIDYLGGTAVAPAANTAGNDLVDAGRIITLDVATTSISVIAVSGTQTIYVRAWR